jgi:TonB family protein
MKIGSSKRFWISQVARSAALAMALICALGGVAGSAQAQSSVQIVTELSKRPIKTKSEPQYPKLAQQLHVLGKVKLQLTVSAEGAVTATKVLGGSPILVKSVEEVVKEWKYEPAGKESTETVEFTFSSSS